MSDLNKYGVEPCELHLSKQRSKTYYYDCLTRIIYVFLKRNPSFVYCQGMNELAALILYSFANKNSEYFRRVAQSDAYVCFEEIMIRLWKLPIPGFLNGQKYANCFEELLKKVDMRLYEEIEGKPGFLNGLKILSIKWFSSLFLNEYGIDQSLVLWDGFLAVIYRDEKGESLINFHNLLMATGLAIVHLNRTALSEGESPLQLFAKIPNSPEALLEKALSLYRIFRQFFL